jgi:enamine deaminase RidA (YjgF/YER057c/UK114 family)
VTGLRAVSPEGWPRPRGYANAIVVPPGRALVLTAGMVGWDETERIVPGGFAAQFEKAVENVLAAVRAAGGGPEHIARMTVYVVDRGEYLAARETLAAAWRRTMGRHYPAMALVQVAGLVEEGARVEIEAVAAVPADAG